MQLTDPIHAVITKAVEATGLSFYGAEFISGGVRPILRIFIDKQGGVLVDDCQLASRQVGAALDVEGVFPKGYILEVSSPGLDRPLMVPAHYAAAVGQNVVIKLKIPKEGRRNLKGKVLSFQDEALSIDVGSEVLQLSLQEIQSARIEPDFFQSHARGG